MNTRTGIYFSTSQSARVLGQRGQMFADGRDQMLVDERDAWIGTAFRYLYERYAGDRRLYSSPQLHEMQIDDRSYRVVYVYCTSEYIVFMNYDGPHALNRTTGELIFKLFNFEQ